MFRGIALIILTITCQPIIVNANYVNVGGPSNALSWHTTRGFYGGNMRPYTNFYRLAGAWIPVVKTWKKVDGSWVEVIEGGGDKNRWVERYYLESIWFILLKVYPARPQYRGDDFTINTTTIASPTEDFSCSDAIVSGSGVAVDSQTKIATVTLDCLDTSGGWTGDKVFRLGVMGYAGLASFLLDGATGTALTVSQRWSYEIKATVLNSEAYIYEFYLEIIDI